ncbi:MAG: phosphatase [Cytophagales bacterium]|nr:phosphatase [Cytophagales bacterium]
MPIKFSKDIIAETAQMFTQLGGEFIIPPTDLAFKLKNIKCFVFDWDGVFNDGIKAIEKTSGFAEVDSMGVHIIRYAYWRLHGVLPIVAIITAQDNKTGLHFAEREHLTAAFAGFKDKSEPLQALQEQYALQKHEIATVFDDIIDYPLAVGSGLRFMIRRNASPMLKQYWVNHKLCDYITGSEQPHFPVREVCELVIALWGNYDDMLISRFTDKETYAKFWNERQSVQTKIITKK